jgi:hypothetical protein
MHIIRIIKIRLCNHIDSDHFDPPFENHNRGTRNCVPRKRQKMTIVLSGMHKRQIKNLDKHKMESSFDLHKKKAK